jgi:hypothetical protein
MLRRPRDDMHLRTMFCCRAGMTQMLCARTYICGIVYRHHAQQYTLFCSLKGAVITVAGCMYCTNMLPIVDFQISTLSSADIKRTSEVYVTAILVRKYCLFFPPPHRHCNYIFFGPGVHSASCTVSFPRVKRSGRGINHLPHLAPRLKKE